MAVSFKGAHYPKEVIFYAVFFYLRHSVSYRDLLRSEAESPAQLRIIVVI